MFRIVHKMMIPWENHAIRRMDYLTPEQMSLLQRWKLNRILRAAYDRSPFYRQRFDSLGARPEDFQRPEDFAGFPILTRDEILANAKAMLTMPAGKLRIGRSGGSTGHPLYFFYHHDYKYYRISLLNRFRYWVGADQARPILLLWGSTMKPNIPPVIRPWHRLLLPDFRYGIAFMDEELLRRIAREFLEIKPALVTGYASTLRSLARFLKENQIPVPHPPKAVISTAEMLLPDDRQLIEERLHAPVYNSYGSNENSNFASECKERQGFHVMADHVYIEILSGNRTAKPGEPGRIILTDLDNPAMPFIRYNTEDIGSWSTRSCPCRRTLPMLDTVYGRDTDFLIDRLGAYYPGINLIVPLRSASSGDRIRQFQYHQTECSRFELLAVKGSAFTPEAESELRQSLQDAFGDKMEFRLTWVDNIPPEPSGKVRFVRSTLRFSDTR